MSDQVVSDVVSPVNQIKDDLSAVRDLMGAEAERARLAKEAEEARALRVQMCGYLLDSALSSSKLPLPVMDRIRKQFAGKVFQAGELGAVIDDSRKMVSELTGGLVVTGPGRITGGWGTVDQVNAAVHDLLGASRPKELEGLKAHKVHGIRDLYTMFTGDYDFVGGFYPERALLAQSGASADLPSVLANVMNKLIVEQWEELGKAGYRWWEKVVQVIHFNSLQAIKGVLVGELALLPSVSEGAEYTELRVSDSSEAGAWAKYGGYVGLTLEMFERDETQRLRQYPRKMAAAGLRRISNLVATVFTADSAVGPHMTDTYNVFDASNHSNLGTTALSSAAFDAASAAIYDQSMLLHSSGSVNPVKMALEAKYLLVPRALKLTAQRILYPSFEREANIFSENMQRGDSGDVIVVPEWTDAKDWAAVADPRLAPAIIVAERFGLLPEIFIADQESSGGPLFTNDQIRMKVRHFLSVFVADHRPLYKANVT